MKATHPHPDGRFLYLFCVLVFNLGMSEITEKQAGDFLRVFLPVYNSEHSSDYAVDPFEVDGGDFDILCYGSSDKKKTLKIQVVESMVTRGKELAVLKKFERGEADAEPIHMQDDWMQIEEAAGHKLNKYPTAELQKDLVILIYFTLFPWKAENLEKMKQTAEKFKGNFIGVYCIRIDPDECLRLA